MPTCKVFDEGCTTALRHECKLNLFSKLSLPEITTGKSLDNFCERLVLTGTNFRVLGGIVVSFLVYKAAQIPLNFGSDFFLFAVVEDEVFEESGMFVPWNVKQPFEMSSVMLFLDKSGPLKLKSMAKLLSTTGRKERGLRLG